MKPRANLLNFEDARHTLLSSAQPLVATETLSLLAAQGRTLAQAITSPINVPGFDNSAMDGYALHVQDIGRLPELSLSLNASRRVKLVHHSDPIRRLVFSRGLQSPRARMLSCPRSILKSGTGRSLSRTRLSFLNTYVVVERISLRVEWFLQQDSA